MHQTTRRFDYAELFGNLFQEWLSSGDSALAAGVAQGGRQTSDFVDIGRKEKHEQLERFTSFVFEEKLVDTAALRSYLDKTFSSKHAQKKLAEVREQLEELCNTIRTWTVTKYDVENAIDGFLSGNGSLSEDNIAALREFKQNDSVLTELASVLTMRLAGIDTWSWPVEGIPVQMRRHLNGKYRACTDPDIVDALLLHYLGVSWQVKFRSIFRSIFFSKAWITTESKLPEAEKARLGLQHQTLDHGVASLRLKAFQETFFLCTLSSSPKTLASYDSSDTATESSEGVSLEDVDAAKKVKSSAQTKQMLLHVQATECQLNTKLYNKHAVVCSDFEWFGPSLPHAAILTVLEFFGVTAEWLGFFRKWLAAPLRFVDGENSGEVRVRKRGTPFNYALSTLCGEVVLFVMDFAVNRASDGLNLYRLHDDLWLSDFDASKCARAWKEMNTFADLVGLTFNKEKTGSACVGYDILGKRGLPSGDVRWGFLKFDASKGRFTIDQAQVDTHIQELRRQLDATKSIMGWINVYNKYMSFLYRNFGGHPAKCFGEEHIDDMLKTFAKIQSDLFQDAGTKSAVAYLQRVIQKKFGINDIPEGYFYFPIATGGLELKNPFIDLCSLERETEKKDKKPKELFDEDDQELYDKRKESWDRNYMSDKGPYMSYVEFLIHRGTWVPQWGTAYQNALTDKDQVSVNVTPAIEAVLRSSNHWPQELSKLNVQDKWLVALYGEQLIEKFGALDVVDSNLIPLGMVELFKRSKIQLDE